MAPVPSDPCSNPYSQRKLLEYREAWTGPLFQELAFVIRVIAGGHPPELVSAWRAVIAAPEPARTRALAVLQDMSAVDYDQALGPITRALGSKNQVDEVRLARDLGDTFRRNYGGRSASPAARNSPPAAGAKARQSPRRTPPCPARRRRTCRRRRCRPPWSGRGRPSQVDAAVDLDPQIEPRAPVRQRSSCAILGKHVVAERLAAEAGLDRHDEHEVDLPEERLHGLGRGPGVERDARPAPCARIAFSAAAMVVGGSTWIVIRSAPGLRERVDEAVRLGQHQVRVEEELRAVAPERRQGLGPKERFGTKWPSMMSRCSHLSPSRGHARRPRPSGAWSPARREGARMGSFMGGIRGFTTRRGRRGSPCRTEGSSARRGSVLYSDWSWSLLVPNGTEPRPLSVKASRWTSTSPALKEHPARAVVAQAAARRQVSVNLRASPLSSSRLAALSRL
jgi:hypothetical protein